MNNQLLFWKEKDKKKKLIERKKKRIPFQKVIITFLKMRLSRVSNIADPMLPYQEIKEPISWNKLLKKNNYYCKMKKIHPNNYVLSVCVVWKYHWMVLKY